MNATADLTKTAMVYKEMMREKEVSERMVCFGDCGFCPVFFSVLYYVYLISMLL